MNSTLNDDSYVDDDVKDFQLYRLSMSVDNTIKSDFIIDSLEKGIYLINDYLCDSPNEMLIGLALDTKRRPLACAVLGVGNDNSIQDVSKNIFRFALLSCADSLVLIHNHPYSDQLYLSEKDKAAVSNYRAIAGALNINLLDFIVVGNSKHDRAYYSWWDDKVITEYDFLKFIKDKDIPSTIDVIGELDNAEKFLSESIYNSQEHLENNLRSNRSKGFFNFFK